MRWSRQWLIRWSNRREQEPKPSTGHNPKGINNVADAGAMAVAGFACARIQRVWLPYFAIGTGRNDRVDHFLRGWAARYPLADRQEDRAGCSKRWSANTPHQVRDADDGWRVNSYRHRRYYTAVGRSRKPVCMGGVDCYPGFWCDRLVRRLEKSGLSRPERFGQSLEIFLAVRSRAAGGDFSGDDIDRARPDGFDCSFLQDRELSARHHWLYHTDLPRYCRYQQRGEPERWSGWLGDHADGNDCRCAGHFCLRCR